MATHDCLITLDTVILPLSTQRNAEYPNVDVTLEAIDIKYNPLSKLLKIKQLPPLAIVPVANPNALKLYPLFLAQDKTEPHLTITSPPSNQPAYDNAVAAPFRPPLANIPAPPPEFTLSALAPLPPIATTPAPPPP